MNRAQAQHAAGVAAVEAVKGSETERLKAYVAAVADWLERDGDYCTDTQWAEKLAYLRGYISGVAA